jgi:sec-independent protein translocase protein TatA
MSLSILMGWVGPNQLIIILVVVLLLFGGRKIPELMRGLGGGLKEFKKAVKDEDSEGEGEAKKKDDSNPS